MNDLPSNLVPPNQRDLERIEQGDKFPAKPDEVNVDKEFKFFVYPFFKMEKNYCVSVQLVRILLLVLFLKLTHNIVKPISLMSIRNQVQLIYIPP